MLLQGYGVPVEKREDAVPPRDWFQTRALLNALSDPDNTLFGEALVRAWAPGNAEEIIRDAAMNLQSLNEASLHLPYLETASQAVDFIAAKKPTEQSLKRLQDALAVLAENGESSISDLQIALAERADDKEVLQAGKVRVLTYWAAKGSEADAVFLPALEQGILPSISQLRTEADLQEARRILYVGVTRAKKHLFLSHAGTRRPFHGKFTGKPEPAQPSQFLSEMGFKP
jgi:superfamily I DNA/RNA helicase